MTAAKAAQPGVDLLRRRHRDRRRPHPPRGRAGRPRRRPVRRPGRHQRRLRRDEGLVPEPRPAPRPRTRTARSPASATFAGKAKFDADYKAEYGIDATGYAGQGFACAQVVLDAISRAGADQAGRHDAALTRGRPRRRRPTPPHTYKTIVGDITFNADGDTSQKIVSIYSFDPAGANGKGDWKFETQVDYAKK